MPWQLIALAFGWRAATDEDRGMPPLVVWHPRLRRYFTGAAPGSARSACRCMRLTHPFRRPQKSGGVNEPSSHHRLPPG
jgi:hypothetical protein